MKLKEIKGVDSVYVLGNEIVITGTPMEKDDDSDGKHNCDAMGCGCEHVLLRGLFRFVEKGYDEEEQEADREHER